MRRRLGGVALAVSLSACAGSASVEGGAVVAPESEPEGEHLAAFTARDCRSEDGRALPAATPLHVHVVKPKGGKVVLVEERPGFHALVVDNVSRTPDDWVFEASLKSDASPRYLLRYEIPARSGAPGQLILARQWTEVETRDGFSGKVLRATVRCALRPDQAARSGLPEGGPGSIVPPS